MKRRITVAAVAASIFDATCAQAQLGSLFGDPGSGEADGNYQSNDQIRTFIAIRPDSRVDLYGKVIVKAAEMSRDKGFPRFGVTKYKCGTTVLNGSPLISTCYVIAIMLGPDGEAKSRGNRAVQYYNVVDVMAGKIARPDEPRED